MPQIQVNDRSLDERLARLEQARSWSPRVISKLESFLRSAPDLDVFRVNPLSYAAERGVSDAEAVDLFLHASKLGLFAMDWHVVCPHCGYVVDSLQHMNQLRAHYQCPICASERDYSLDDYIQIGFSVSPDVREIVYHHPESLDVEDLFYNCKLSRDVISPLPALPAWRDVIVHVTQYLRYVAPGEKVTAELGASPGALRATDGRNCLQLSLSRERSEQARRISIRLADGKFQSNDGDLQPRTLIGRTADDQPVSFRFALERELASGNLLIELENLQPQRSALFIYHPGEGPTPMLRLRPGLSGKRLLATQTFRDLFRSELIASDETLSIRDITFLFTDLKSSTAMYERVGDAKAYFLVRQHFDTLGRVIRERRGAVVKTIGDAVMAVFDDPVDATSAALEMIDALQELNRTLPHELSLKVGVHRGHSMAVTVNERIDYFGQCVNIAARVQGLADADEVYLSADVYDSPGVQALLQAHHAAPAEVLVKGVSEKLRVYKVGRRASQLNAASVALGCHVRGRSAGLGGGFERIWAAVSLLLSADPWC